VPPEWHPPHSQNKIYCITIVFRKAITMDAQIPNLLLKILPLLIPLILIQLGLMAFCLVDLARREHTRGPKWMWALIIILGELIGPIVYLVVGRQE
jgi:DMSO reductase anchor subunit